MFILILIIPYDRINWHHFRIRWCYTRDPFAVLWLVYPKCGCTRHCWYLVSDCNHIHFRCKLCCTRDLIVALSLVYPRCDCTLHRHSPVAVYSPRSLCLLTWLWGPMFHRTRCSWTGDCSFVARCDPHCFESTRCNKRFGFQRTWVVE